jgi:hypothetical protein
MDEGAGIVIDGTGLVLPADAPRADVRLQVAALREGEVREDGAAAVAHYDVFGIRGYGLNVHSSVSLGSCCISLMVLQAEDFIGGVEISTQLNNLISLTNQPTVFQF